MDKTYKKTRPDTELIKIKRLFPNYNTTRLKAEYTTDGKIIKLITDNPALQAILRTEGFIET